MKLRLIKVAIFAGSVFPALAAGFTVRTRSTPMGGHELLTVCAAEGGCDYDQVDTDFGADKDFFYFSPPFSSAPVTGRDWGSEADWKNYLCPGGCERFGAGSPLVWSTVIGARWVDLRGLSIAEPSLTPPSVSDGTVPLEPLRCWHAVTQGHDSVQHDHFLRKRTDLPTDPVSTTVAAIAARFKSLFREAVSRARANSDDQPASRMIVIDGGDKLNRYKVNEGYFLLGRAMHLLQDSFSSEHASRETVRGAGGKVSRAALIKGVKSQVCTPGAQKHTPRDGLSSFFGEACISLGGRTSPNGDVVFQGAYGSDLKVAAQLAVVASRDLFILFKDLVKRTAAPDIDNEVSTFVQRWFDGQRAAEGTGEGSTFEAPKECHASDPYFCDAKRGEFMDGYFNECLAQFVSASTLAASRTLPTREETYTHNGTVKIKLPGYDAKLPDWVGTSPVECVMAPVNAGTRGKKFALHCAAIVPPTETIWQTISGAWGEFKRNPTIGLEDFGGKWCTSGWDLFLADNVKFFGEVSRALTHGDPLSVAQYSSPQVRDHILKRTVQSV